PRRRVLRSPGYGRAIAVAPREQTHALIEGDLLPHLKVARTEPERGAPRVRRRFGLPEQLERSREPPQRLRAPRRERRGLPQRSNRGRDLLAGRLHVGELLQAGGLRRPQDRRELQQLLRARQIPPG